MDRLRRRCWTKAFPTPTKTSSYEVDIRYQGQGLLLTVNVDLDELRSKGMDAVGKPFDDEHEQLFTFALDAEKEVVNLRAVVQGKATQVRALNLEEGSADASDAVIATDKIYVEGAEHDAKIYDRSKLKANNEIAGPAIVVEMDSTTLILPDHVGKVDHVGMIVINPATK